MSEQLSHRGEVLQEGNPELEAATRKKAERKLGAKILSGVGFQDRQAEIADSSLKKEKARGEKFQGKNAERRNLAYLARLERMIEKDGNALEKKLWDASVEKLIIEPDDIEENYWKTQEQILRDNGQERKLNDYEKELLTKDIQKRQRDSLKSWADYLGDEQAPYPLWFKVYAWDGMSKMGVFDKGEGEFKKRNEQTVAPYPKLNPAVLAKVHGAVDDFYKYKNNKDKTNGKSNKAERDKKLDALVQSGNFNKLYSKFLLEQKSIPPTPERTEDVHGSWIEYLPGQEEALANAAEGTPWCIADPGTAKNYLERGVSGQADDEDWDDEEGVESKAKFILFHLEDPETGNLAENACASIRLGTDGQVAEISGLKDGSKQVLEDSLVPIVEEKVKTLPGGEKFLEAFADKQKLIELDRKMQRGEKLTGEELQFVFEVNEKERAQDFNAYNDEGDPRVYELRDYFLEHLDEYATKDVQNAVPHIGLDNIDTHFDQLLRLGVDPASLMECMTSTVIGRHFDQLIGAGVNPKVLIEKMDSDYVDNSFDRLIEFGVAPEMIAQRLVFNSINDQHAKRLLERGVDVNELTLRPAGIESDFDQLIDLGADPNKLILRLSSEFIEEHFDQLLELNVDLNELIGRMPSGAVAKKFDSLLELGVDPDVLVKNMSGGDIVNHFEQLLNVGVSPNVLVRNMYGENVAEYFDKLVELGADIDELVNKMDLDAVDAHFERIIALGVDLKVLLDVIMREVDIEGFEFYRSKLLRAGVDADHLNELVKNYEDEHDDEDDDDEDGWWDEESY